MFVYRNNIIGAWCFFLLILIVILMVCRGQWQSHDTSYRMQKYKIYLNLPRSDPKIIALY